MLLDARHIQCNEVS